ncbi:serine/arginine repetitive matrix protein 2 isoform X3 [Frankliniella occidentalis]|uniref:cGMP-dependent protein kinase n=1 Tax=Frankliniella occidentalis TaxID=133901 RepID=A0A9C6XWC1_FRAOC|nr:serine/arginine repetitive matrix protein 2 isoform X3 [Frankliniella occidentalis]
MDWSLRRRRSSSDSSSRGSRAVTGTARDGDASPASISPFSTRKTVSLTLCVISTEQVAQSALVAPLAAGQEGRDEQHKGRKEERGERDKEDQEKKKRGKKQKADGECDKQKGGAQRKKSPIEKFRESLLHWGRSKAKARRGMSPPAPAGARPGQRPPSPPLALAAAPRPARPSSLGLTVIGGPGAGAPPEPRRGSLNQGSLGHVDEAFRALDQGPQLRPYAVGAPLRAPLGASEEVDKIPTGPPTATGVHREAEPTVQRILVPGHSDPNQGVRSDTDSSRGDKKSQEPIEILIRIPDSNAQQHDRDITVKKQDGQRTEEGADKESGQERTGPRNSALEVQQPQPSNQRRTATGSIAQEIQQPRESSQGQTAPRSSTWEGQQPQASDQVRIVPRSSAREGQQPQATDQGWTASRSTARGEQQPPASDQVRIVPRSSAREGQQPPASDQVRIVPRSSAREGQHPQASDQGKTASRSSALEEQQSQASDQRRIAPSNINDVQGGQQRQRSDQQRTVGESFGKRDGFREVQDPAGNLRSRRPHSPPESVPTNQSVSPHPTSTVKHPTPTATSASPNPVAHHPSASSARTSIASSSSTTSVSTGSSGGIAARKVVTKETAASKMPPPGETVVAHTTTATSRGPTSVSSSTEPSRTAPNRPGRDAQQVTEARAVPTSTTNRQGGAGSTSGSSAGKASSGNSVSFAGNQDHASAVRPREPPRPRSPHPGGRGTTPPPRTPTPPPPPPPRTRTPTSLEADAGSSSSSSCSHQGTQRLTPDSQQRRHCGACSPRKGSGPGTASGVGCETCKRAGGRARSKEGRSAGPAPAMDRKPLSPPQTAVTSPRTSARAEVQKQRAHSASPARRMTPTAAGQGARVPLAHLAARNSGQPIGRTLSCRGPRTAVHQESTPPLSPLSVQLQGPLSPGWDLVALEMEVQELRRELQERRAAELRLRREIHKLRSVLQQATSFSQDGEGGDVAREDGVSGDAREGLLLTSLQVRHAMAGGRATGCGPGAAQGAAQGVAQGAAQATAQQGVAAASSSKKQGVSGESSDPGSSSVTQATFPKDFRSQQLIKAAILDNDFLKNLSRSQIRELVDCMYLQSVTRGSYVIREGEAGSHLYVLAEGEMEVMKEDTVLGRTGPGKAFGELAILYNCTRTASIRAVTDLQVWVLDRKMFQQIMMRTGMQRIEENLSFLTSVPLLKKLSVGTLHKIADVLEVEFYPAGSYIVRQGASGHTFFIISGGTVQVTQRVPGTVEEMVIRELGRGDYFGEQALLHDDFRTASVIATAPGVECLTLDRESFLSLIGSLSELQEKDYGDENRQLSRTSSSYSVHSDLSPTADCEVDLLRLEDLQVVGTLGVGGFGSVRLVVPAGTPGRSFALKCLNKNHIVATGQQEHVLGEKDILMSVHSPFVVRLYRTFRDERCVYMLLEACLGGEVWSMLRERGRLDEEEARFAAACVVQALEYLHARRIIYRDLKPENLVLDARGYVKLVDFGFSKRLVDSNKTWTFCGTPEYVAPEVILNRGHDRAVDCWALGVLVFELLTGAPPFSAADPMRTYNFILKGIESVAMPAAVGRSAAHLIRSLCKAVPAERLGYQRAGLQDVRRHKWFQGFDWEGLVHQTLQPPIVPKVSGPTDMSNFDTSCKEEDTVLSELSLWEADF